MVKKSKIKKSSLSSNQSKNLTETAPQSQADLSKYRRRNLVLSLLMLAQAVIIGLMAKSTYFSITDNFLNVDPLASQASGSQVLVAASRHAFDLNMRYWVVAFLLFSALFYGLLALKSRDKTDEQVSKRNTLLKWMDYGLSSGLMLVIVAVISGMRDISSLILIFVLVLVMHAFGCLLDSESGLNKSARFKNLVALMLCGFAAWLSVGVYLKAAIVYGVGLPHSSYFIIGSTFLLTVLLAVNTFMSYRSKGKWASPKYVDTIYVVLSVTARTALAWQIFFAVLR